MAVHPWGHGAGGPNGRQRGRSLTGRDPVSAFAGDEHAWRAAAFAAE
jgi:hypothetical protein